MNYLKEIYFGNLERDKAFNDEEDWSQRFNQAEILVDYSFTKPESNSGPLLCIWAVEEDCHLAREGSKPVVKREKRVYFTRSEKENYVQAEPNQAEVFIEVCVGFLRKDKALLHRTQVNWQRVSLKVRVFLAHFIRDSEVKGSGPYEPIKVIFSAVQAVIEGRSNGISLSHFEIEPVKKDSLYRGNLGNVSLIENHEDLFRYGVVERD